MNKRFIDPSTSAQTAFNRAAIQALAEDPTSIDLDSLNSPELSECLKNTRDLGEPLFRIELGPIAAYAAQGYLGQWLVVVPDDGVVVVRQGRHRKEAGSLGRIVATLAQKLASS